MKKIGLITFYKDNFGSILQCYATKYVLERMGYECDILYEVVHEPSFLQKKITGLARLIHGYLFDKEYVEKRKIAKSTPQPLSRKTWDMMDAFVEKEFTPKGYSFDELCNIEKKYDLFIVGSDQVWNAFNPIPQSQFLKFTTDSKKIAFAISFGTDKPSNNFLKVIKIGIRGFNNISVREESGVDIVKKVTDAPVERIADPTLMLNADEWRGFCKDEDVGGNYILVHFLNTPNENAVKMIEKLQTEYKIRVICIGYKYDIFDKFSWDFLDCSPRQYVAYIDNASYICTDSFHTTLFSINLEKKFYVFNRQYLHTHPQTGRISDILERYKFSDRLIVEPKLLQLDGGDSRNVLLEDERNRTLKYLRTKLNRINVGEKV